MLAGTPGGRHSPNFERLPRPYTHLVAWWKRDRQPRRFGAARVDPDICTELVAVVGEAQQQEVLHRVSRRRGVESVQWPCEATLVREPDNPFDPRAVAVYIEGSKVGYLSRGDALDYGPFIERAAPTLLTFGANIAGRGPGAATANLGVFLLMPPAE